VPKTPKVMEPRTGHARKAAPGECAGNNMYTVRDRPALTIVKRVNVKQTYRSHPMQCD